jgi:hypothetical protein
MDNKQLIKGALIFGGGFLIFALLRRPKDKTASTSVKKSAEGDKSLAPAPTPENAEIVLIAYTDALKNGEPASRLTELNKECMKEFGLRCYIDQKTGKTVVCDVKGETILSK